jgi:ABC-type phosphate transport system permease subunit
MSQRDRGMAIAMLAEAFGVKDLTPARIRIYDEALKEIPQPLRHGGRSLGICRLWPICWPMRRRAAGSYWTG